MREERGWAEWNLRDEACGVESTECLQVCRFCVSLSGLWIGSVAREVCLTEERHSLHQSVSPIC